MKRRLRSRWSTVVIGLCLAALIEQAAFNPHVAYAAPSTISVQDFLTAMDLSAEEVEAAKKGEIIAGKAPESSERELVATMAFVIEGVTPDELVERGEGGLLDAVDDQTIAFSILPENPSLESFAGLRLRAGDLEDFASAEAGVTLNLSAGEIEALGKLDQDSPADQVELAVRAVLLSRVQAYKAKGLAGIAPYQRSTEETRSAAEELKSATLASHSIQEIAPLAYKLLLEYPASVPAGTEEVYRWSYFEAHGETTIVLTHSLYIPDGESWMVVQRQFYVSRGYNSEQAVAAFVPLVEGTAVFYINRTSTDQVAGFGGGAKRSIGSKLLVSQLEALYSKAGKAASLDE